MGDYFPPFSYTDNNVKKGMAYEIVRKVVEESGVEAERSIIGNWKDVSKYTSISLEKATITDYILSKGASVHNASKLSQAYQMFLKERGDLLVMLDYSFSL